MTKKLAIITIIAALLIIGLIIVFFIKNKPAPPMNDYEPNLLDTFRVSLMLNKGFNCSLAVPVEWEGSIRQKSNNFYYIEPGIEVKIGDFKYIDDNWQSRADLLFSDEIGGIYYEKSENIEENEENNKEFLKVFNNFDKIVKSLKCKRVN